MSYRKNRWIKVVSEVGYRMFGLPAELFGFVGLDFKNIFHVNLVAGCLCLTYGYSNINNIGQIYIHIFSELLAVIWKLNVPCI